jgi:hypothetical protein
MKIAVLKKIFLALTVVAVLVTGAVCYIIHHIGTVDFAVKSILSAIESKDWDRLNRFVDMEAVHESMVGANSESRENAHVMASSILSNLKDETMRLWRMGVEQPDEKPSFMGRFLSPDLLKNAKIDRSGRTAILKISPLTRYLDIAVPVFLTFRKGKWHFVFIGYNSSKLSAADDKIVEILADHYNLPIIDSLKKSVSVETTGKRKGCADWGYSICLTNMTIIDRKFTNNTDRDIDLILYHLHPNKYAQEKLVDRMTDIPAGTSRSTRPGVGYKYNRFIEIDRMIASAALADLYYEVVLIQFKDGGILARRTGFCALSRIDYAINKPTIDDVLHRRANYGLTDANMIRQIITGT